MAHTAIISSFAYKKKLDNYLRNIVTCFVQSKNKIEKKMFSIKISENKPIQKRLYDWRWINKEKTKRKQIDWNDGVKHSRIAFRVKVWVLMAGKSNVGTHEPWHPSVWRTFSSSGFSFGCYDPTHQLNYRHLLAQATFQAAPE